MGKPPLSPNLREKPPESMHTQFRDMLALKLARNPVKTAGPQLAGNCCPSIFVNDSFDRPKDNIELLLSGDCLQRSLDTAAQIVCTPW